MRTFNITEFYLFMLLFLTTNLKLFADKNSFKFWFPDENHTVKHFVEDTDCNTQFNNNDPESFEPSKTFLTMYGDSLGDFIDEPAYGYFGWDQYLTLMNFSVEWNVQNLAIGGYTTKSVYEFIAGCALTPERRINFKTAPNVAFEIGGNDFWHNALLLTYMPWKFSSVVGRVAFNTKSILYQLRNPRRNKDILVMGNFPNLSYSPTLGNMNQYFSPMATQPDSGFSYNMSQLQSEQKNAMREEEEASILTLLPPTGWITLLYMPIDLDHLHTEFVESILYIKEAYNRVIVNLEIQTGIEELDMLRTQIKNAGTSPTMQDDWYWLWLHRVKNNVSMVTSLGMYFSQGAIEQAAQEVNGKYGKVQFLPLYHLFIRQRDCFEFGQCWVANPWLYQDQIGHLNYIGYTVWAGALSAKVIELDWHNSLRNGPPHYDGAVSIPGDDTVVVALPEEQPPQNVEVEEWPIDFWILVCIFTGKCW